jgi:hypothetical protein
MKRILALLAALAIVQSVVGCSLEKLTDAKLQEVRERAVSSQAEFRRIASVIVQSPIQYANGKTVRYLVEGGGSRTEAWEAAEVPPVIRNELREFFSAGQADAIFVNAHRVNFGMWGTGLAVSGVTIGVIVAPDEELSCNEVVTSVRLDRRGLQCERLNDATYFYLWRD